MVLSSKFPLNIFRKIAEFPNLQFKFTLDEQQRTHRSNEHMQSIPNTDDDDDDDVRYVRNVSDYDQGRIQK